VNHNLPHAVSGSSTRVDDLARVAASLNAQRDLTGTLAVICAEAAQTLGVCAASIRLWDEQRIALYHAGAYGIPAEQSARIRPISPALYDQWSDNPGEVSIVPGVHMAGGLPDEEMLMALDVRTLATARIIRDGQLIGSLHAYACGDDAPFGPDALAVLQTIAHMAATAIVNARLQAQSRRTTALAQTLHTVDVAITSSHDLRVILNVCLQQLTAFLQIDAADVRLLNPHTLALEYTSGRGFRTQAIQRYSPRLGEGPAGNVALHRNVAKIPDIRQEGLEQSSLLVNEGFVSYVALPLIAKGQVNGVLEVFQRARFEPDADWLEYLQTLARQAAIAVDNALTFDRLQRTNTELALAFDESIEGWARALDLRCHEPEGHSAHLAEVSLALAKAAGINSDELTHLRRGALLHDLGKLSIPESILLKPGPLEPDEWTLVRRHPQHAHDLLWPYAHLRRAIDIPTCHQEKWDGSGYPSGLIGEQIPLAARIFAVAEVWEVLRSERPYRKAWSDEQARTYIYSASGTHFDPRIVDVFRNLNARGMLPPRFVGR
jgi:HD-GYP domain-containing protein (c-di-GMP phosphodiesterase class II)